MTNNNLHIGSSFEDFSAEEGLLEECTNAVIKRVIAWQVEHAMQERGLTKAAMAHQMHTSCAALDRLLDPENTSVTLHTLQRAAVVIGKRVQITLEDAHPYALYSCNTKYRERSRKPCRCIWDTLPEIV